MTDLRKLAQAVVETYADCEALCDAHTVGEWIIADEARAAAEGAIDDVLGLAGALSTDNDRSEAAEAILAALDAERHQQTRRMIAALYWRAGEARSMAGPRDPLGQVWELVARAMEQHL